MTKQAPRPDHRKTPKLIWISGLTALAFVAISLSAFALK